MIVRWIKRFYTWRRFECPVCKCRLKAFLPFGLKSSANVQCPVCKSLERHRLIWLYFHEKTNLFRDNLRMLEVAPVFLTSERLKKLPNLDYISADLNSPGAMVKMDITDIQYPDDSFDVIYASHVLEHIEDDVKAMRELCRVLRPGGWAVLQVPMRGEKTLEGPDAGTPEERARLYGQDDHVRIYGFDGKYRERLEEAGFKVTVDPFAKTLGPEKIKRYGLKENEDIYCCVK